MTHEVYYPECYLESVEVKQVVGITEKEKFPKTENENPDLKQDYFI
jgi:hypothetical protein